jgi:hypothetical protein
MTLQVSVGVFSCSSFGHSAWFTPRSVGENARAAREEREPGLVIAFSDE